MSNMISDELKDQLRQGSFDYRRILDQPTGDNVFAHAKTKTNFKKTGGGTIKVDKNTTIADLDKDKQAYILNWMDKLMDDTRPKTAASAFLRDTQKSVL